MNLATTIGAVEHAIKLMNREISKGGMDEIEARTSAKALIALRATLVEKMNGETE